VMNFRAVRVSVATGFRRFVVMSVSKIEVFYPEAPRNRLCRAAGAAPLRG
jgi:hypothetical protein